MKLIIDIPEALYRTVQDGTYCGTLYEELKNGTLLPKGHGRLIDADAYAKKYNTNINGRIGDEYIIAPTIIKADKAESEG